MTRSQWIDTADLDAALSAYHSAMERVVRRLRRVAVALNGAGIPYAVCGGNAVAAWIATIDPSGTRTTKDVDILLRRADIEAATRALKGIGFERHDIRSITLFVDPEEPSRKAGVHIVWAEEPVRPSYSVPAPSVEDAVRVGDGDLRVLGIGALVRMKLTSFRPIDRVHLADLMSVGLIDAAARAALPAELILRLSEVERDAAQSSLDDDIDVDV